MWRDVDLLCGSNLANPVPVLRWNAPNMPFGHNVAAQAERIGDFCLAAQSDDNRGMEMMLLNHERTMMAISHLVKRDICHGGHFAITVIMRNIRRGVPCV
jgi:hypothetical protein